jgi:hypothetical protein
MVQVVVAITVPAPAMSRTWAEMCVSCGARPRHTMADNVISIDAMIPVLNCGTR